MTNTGCEHWFLEHLLRQPLSRLSFSTYLLHGPVFVATTMNSLYVTERADIGNYATAFLVGIIATLEFKMTIGIIHRLIFR